MAFLDPYDLPPIDDWEAFQAWLARQGASEARTKVPSPGVASSAPAPEPYSGAEELRQTLISMGEDPTRFPAATPLPPLSQEEITSGRALGAPELPKLNQEEITSGRAFKIPEAQPAAMLPISIDVFGRKHAAIPGMITEPLKGFEKALKGELPTHQFNPETGEVELSEEIMSTGIGAAQLSLAGGLVGTGAKGVRAPTAREIAPSVYKWIDESPRAKIVEEPSGFNLIPEEGVLGSTGVLQKRTVSPRGGFYHTKVKEEFALGKENVNVTYSIAKGRAGGAEAEVDFSVLAPHETAPSFTTLKPIAAKATTPKQGRDTLFTVASSVEKFVEQAKPERVVFIAADDRLVSTYDAFARSLARKYDGVVVESPLEGGMATIEFPKNSGVQFDPSVLRSGLPDFIAIMSAPYVIAGAIHAAKRWWPKAAIRTGEILDPTETLGPKILMNFDRPKDLMKTITSSPVSGMLSLLKGLGYDNKTMFNAFETNTLAAEGQKISHAIESGSAVTIAGDYLVPDGLSAGRVTNAVRSLPPEQQVQASQYVHLHDQLRRMRNAGANRIAGMSLRDIQTNIRAIEAAFPQVKDFLAMHDKVMHAGADFLSKGPDPYITKKQATEMRNGTFALHEFEPVDPNAPLHKRISERAHSYGFGDDVAPVLLDKKLGMTNAPRVDAFEMLNRATEIMLRAKIANSRKINLIRALESTGKDAIVQVGKNQKEYAAIIKNHPKWKERITLVRKNGKPTRYISSMFIKDMLRLDPHIAKMYWLYTTSRAFQFGTTGYGKPTFALTQLYREAILGPLSTPKGMKGVGIPGVPFSALPQAALSVLEQGGRRFQKSLSDEIYRSLDSGSGGVMRMAFGGNEKAMRAVADSMGKSYVNSIYHLYNQRGGAGISMSQSPIMGSQKAAWNEITRNMSAPSYVRLAAHTYMSLFDAMQNSTRYAFWKANYKKGKKTGKITEAFMDEITRESRHLTGELMISGRTYTGKTGRLIASDYPKNWKNAAIPAYARTLDALRESTVWVNALIKGQERVARAYWENPFKFTSYMYTGVFLPMTFAYMWAASRGPEYLDYLESGRSEYEKGATIYFPPLDENAKPEDGWAVPVPPEIAPLVYIYNNLMHSTFGGEFGIDPQVPDVQTQAKSIMKNWFGIVTPPVATAIAGGFGVKVPGSIPGFGEEAYIPKENPYSNFNSNTEIFLKAMFGSAIDGYIRPMNTLLEEGSVSDAWNEFWYLQKQQAPTIKKQQLHGYTELSEAYWDRLDKLRKLDDIYQAHISKPGTVTKEQAGDVIGYGPEFNLIPETRVKLTKKGKPYKNERKEIISTDPRVALSDMPVELLGRPEIPKPTNPEYTVFAKEIHDHFQARGSGAYGKMVSRLSNITKQIQSLKRENTSTLKGVKENIDSMPDDEPLKAELQQMDWGSRDSLRQAINVLEKERRQTYKTMNYYVKEVEEKLGIKLDKLDPYAPPEAFSLGIGAP